MSLKPLYNEMFSTFCLVILTVFVIIELQAARKKNVLTIYNCCINNCDDPGETHIE